MALMLSIFAQAVPPLFSPKALITIRSANANLMAEF